MSENVWLLLALVVVAAAWLVAHAAVMLAALRNAGVAQRWRMLAWLPPAAPVLAWLAGGKARSVVWTVLGVTYGLLWVRAGG